MLDSLTINPVPFPLKSSFVTISGTKDSSIEYVYVNGDAENTVFITNTIWQYDLHLDIGLNVITVQAEDYATNKSDVFTIKIELPEINPVIFNYYNYLDDIAAETNLIRLPGEKNFYLKNRILDAENNKPNTTYEGLIRASARELSIPVIEDVITIDTLYSSSEPRTANCFVTVTDTEILIESDRQIITKEIVYIDPGSNTGVLDYIPIAKTDITLQREDGSILTQSEFELYDRQYIRLTRPEHVLATYKYYHVISLDVATTIQSLANAIGTLSPIVVSVSQNTTYNSYLTKYLIKCYREPVDTEFNFHISTMALCNLADEIFRDSLLDTHGSYFDTPLEKYANITRNKGRIFLKDTILDTDSLVNIDPNEKLEVLPYLFDSYLRYYIQSDSTERFTEKDYIRGSGVGPTGLNFVRLGLDKSSLQSGTGYDLKMVGIV